MPAANPEVFDKVKEALIDALGVDDDEVTEEATMVGDLGAESIDFLDIVFKLEKSFDIQIPRDELFPDDILTNAEFVQDGKVTEKGLSTLKERVPHFDFAQLESDPSVENVSKIFTVDALVTFCEQKLQTA